MTQPEQPAPPAPPAAPPPAPPPAAAQPLPPAAPPAPSAVAPAPVRSSILTSFRPPNWLSLDPGGWRGTIALAASLALLVFGTQIINAAIPAPGATRPSDLGEGVTVSKRLVVHPVSGWKVDARLANMPGVRLARGAASLDVRETTFTGGGGGKFLAAYVKEVIAPDSTQFDLVSVDNVVIGGRFNAVRATYVGQFKNVAGLVEGQMTGIVFDDGLAIVFDAWASQGTLAGSLPDVQRMIETMEIGS